MYLILSIVRANCLISFWTAFWTLWRDHWNIWYKYHNKHIFSEQAEQNLFPSMILQTVPKYLTLHLDSGEFFSSVINTKLYWESRIQFWLGFFFSFSTRKYGYILFILQKQVLKIWNFHFCFDIKRCYKVESFLLHLSSPPLFFLLRKATLFSSWGTYLWTCTSVIHLNSCN